jgi:predicted TIM-barrel fold metal-dependent hydrolase
MASVLQRNIQEMITAAGAGRLAFGTGMAFNVPDPALLKLEVLDTSKAVKEKIAWKNAAKMLGIRGMSP